MSTIKVILIGPFMGLAFVGCTATTNTPIIAGAVDSVGIWAGAGAKTAGGAALALGFKGAKFAIVPVEAQDGRALLLRENGRSETYSVFAGLGVDAKGGSAAGVAVEQVLAVGPAADEWAKNAPVMPKISQ